jgi:hypothetical protein
MVMRRNVLHLVVLTWAASSVAAPTSPTSPTGVGTAGPATVAAAADGSWVVLCTYGDEQEAYLVVGTGPGARIDDVVGIDPSGERILLERKLHPGKGKDRDVSALGGVAFANGQELIYSKRAGNATRFVVRDLASGREHELDPGPGEVYSSLRRGRLARAADARAQAG